MCINKFKTIRFSSFRSLDLVLFARQVIERNSFWSINFTRFVFFISIHFILSTPKGVCVFPATYRVRQSLISTHLKLFRMKCALCAPQYKCGWLRISKSNKTFRTQKKKKTTTEKRKKNVIQRIV